MSSEPPSAAAGHGLATVDEASGTTLDTLVPGARRWAWRRPPVPGLPASERHAEDRGVRLVAGDDRGRTTSQAAPADAADAYLRLHLLSHRLVRPHAVNLDGIFGVLPNVAWTSAGPVGARAARRGAAARPRGRRARSASTASTSSRG